MKLNIDTLPQLATALHVKSVPSVFLVHRGNVVDTFTGIPSEARLKEFVDTALLLESMGHDERVITTLLEKAQEFAARGEWEPAEKMYLEGSKHEAWQDKFGPSIQVGLAMCALKKKDIPRTKELLKKVSDAAKKNLPEFYISMLSHIEDALNEHAFKPSEAELQLIDQVDKDPSNLDLRYQLALLQNAEGRYGEVIETCL